MRQLLGVLIVTCVVCSLATIDGTWLHASNSSHLEGAAGLCWSNRHDNTFSCLDAAGNPCGNIYPKAYNDDPWRDESASNNLHCTIGNCASVNDVSYTGLACTKQNVP